MMKQLLKPVSMIAAAALLAGCTMKKQEAPPLTGPSEYSTSLALAASPDTISQDGSSQSLVTITATDASGQPVRNLSLRVEIGVGGTMMDYGSLSARNLVTGNDGRATVVYTAPPGASGFATSSGTVVDVYVTPIGTDYLNTASRMVSIRLVPTGVVIPPDGLQPRFTFAPDDAIDNQPVLFDASTSEAPPNNPIEKYEWNFGDGSSASGRTASHSYSQAGVYIVTLTVTDYFERSASTTKSVPVGAGVGPTAAFAFSPTEPLPGVPVNFNASASTAAPGRTIESYTWDFGDGTSGSGRQAAHTYATSGSYNVTLVVTDDVGRTATATETVTIGTDNPTADFTFSPTAPAAGSAVNFNGSSSRAVSGRTITNYFWSFGDGASGSGSSPTHTFTTPGSYNVTLTVTDSAGKTATVTKAVNVS